LGKWENFFIKKFIEKYEKKYEFIYIKVPYFDTKTEFRKKILSEIHRVFKKNKIITSSLKDLMSYFNVNDEGIKLGFISFNLNKLLSENTEDDYREVLISIKDNLNYLEKKVVIILDDFDRIENKGQILEVLNFIGELNIEFNESIALITLSSYEKLSDIVGENVNKKEGKKYLEKYFDKIFYLPNSNLFELIDFFSDVYDISIRKKEIIKKIISLINKYNEKLLVDEEINFRNIERVIKSIKEINIKEQEYDIIYEEAYVFWEVVEYLLPDCWDKLKKYKLDLKNLKMNKEFFYNILLELKWYKILKKIKLEKREEFIFSILESVKKYKLGEYDKPISYYLSIKDKMLKNEINQKYKFEDYQNVNQIFNFEIDERKEIFNFLMNNSNINKYETLELMISYKLNYNWKYKNSIEFLKDLENKEEGELPSDERTNGKFYIFLKKLLLVNLFIDINKIENLKEKELYTKNNKHLSTFFSPFLRKGIEKEEYNIFVQEICKMRKNTEQNIVDDDVKTNIESLKLELINVKYLEEDLSEDLKEIEFLKNRLKKLNKKEQDEVLNFLKEKDESLYEMWIDYLISK
jgi:KAP P-loop domain protein